LAMSTVLVTVCMNRKTVLPVERLKAQDLPSGPQSYVSATWRNWLREANRSTAAKHLYAGRGFAETTLAAERFGADLWVVSAGLGLVHGEEEVPAYDLTLSAGSESSVRQKVADGPFDAPLWWSDIGRRKRPKRSLFNLVSARANEQFVISVPGSYLELIEEDLLSLKTSDLSRARLVGPMSTAEIAEHLRPLVMPYDDRFNAPDSPLPGTRADFPQRVARHFLEQIWADSPDADIDEHARRVRESQGSMSWPKQVERRQLGDDEIVKVILSCWDRADGQSTKMLRVLRDEKGSQRARSLCRSLQAREATAVRTEKSGRDIALACGAQSPGERDRRLLLFYPRRILSPAEESRRSRT
jgi:hypothetical protein